MKIRGHEFNEWYQNHWPGADWYIDYISEEDWDEKTDTVKDMNALYDTRNLGVLFWQGDDRDDPTGGNGITVEKCIRDWRKKRTKFSMVVEGDIAQFEYAKTTIKGLGFKVIA